MKKKLIILGTIILLYSISCYKIYNYSKNISVKLNNYISKPIKTDKIGYLVIDKLNIYQPLYKIDSIHNNVDENITILKDSIMPDKPNSIIILAAHSGAGKIAYFENINKLKQGDIIKVKYKNIIYQYKINNIWEEDKNGYIHINKEKENQLILTTCSPNNNDKQLVINSIKH